MADAKVREGLVVDADPAAQPLERQVLPAQPGEGAGAADAFDGGEEPQGHEQARIGRRVAGPALHRLDGGVQRREIEPLDEGPDQTHAVLRGHEVVEAQRPQLDLRALGPTQPRPPGTGRLGPGLGGQRVEQRLVHGLLHIVIGITMSLPHLVAFRRNLRPAAQFIYRL